MKKIIFTLSLILMATLFAFAQESASANKSNMTAEQKAEIKSQKMAKELSLNADQQTKVKAAILKKQQAMEGLRTKYANDKTGMEAEKKKLKDQKDMEMKNILTADQYKKYQNMKEEKEEKSNKSKAKM